MGVKGRKHFDREFKLAAIRMVLEEDRTVTDVAKDLGINRSLLYRWLQRFRDDPNQVFPGRGKRPPENPEEALKRENAQLKDDIAILKKALAIFSDRPKPD